MQSKKPRGVACNALTVLNILSLRGDTMGDGMPEHWRRRPEVRAEQAGNLSAQNTLKTPKQLFTQRLLFKASICKQRLDKR